MRQAAVSVVGRLQAAGYAAMFAGGCVRDMLMAKRPHDYDVATSAKPKDVLALFKRTQKVGAKFGVVLVRIGPFAIEVATFRADSDYEDGRHPTRVHFTDAREDSLRRDFTVNGMFYDPIKRETVDYVGGRVDLAAKVIRAIGDPARRFAEDHLRILRAIRFASRLDFVIEPATWSAMIAQAPLIQRISPERIREELDQMFSHPNRARAFAYLHDSQVLAHLWPGADETARQAREITLLLQHLSKIASFELAMAAVLRRLPVRRVEEVCGALRCSNYTKKTTGWLVAHQDDLTAPNAVTMADLKLLMANPAFGDLLRLFAARLSADGQSLGPHRRILARARAIPSSEVAPPPLLDGHALAGLGLPPGPVYKRILDKVYYAQLGEEVRNASAARAYAQRLLRETSDD